jgi:hypothetical protein
MLSIRGSALAVAATATVVGYCLCGRSAMGADGQGRAIQGSERFAGKLAASTPQGKKVTVNVDLKIWNVSSPQLRVLPVAGFYIANAISGQLITVINGKSEVHAPGDFWTVPNGMSMSVATKSESATIQTIAVSSPSSSRSRPQ